MKKWVMIVGIVVLILAIVAVAFSIKNPITGNSIFSLFKKTETPVEYDSGDLEIKIIQESPSSAASNSAYLRVTCWVGVASIGPSFIDATMSWEGVFTDLYNKEVCDWAKNICEEKGEDFLRLSVAGMLPDFSGLIYYPYSCPTSSSVDF